MFDLDTQSGVMTLLASVRASSLAPAEKNELRDLIFLYTNGGRDASVKIELEQKLRSHNLAVVPAQKSVASASSALPFGSSRPVPTFKAPSVSVSASPAPAPTAATQATSAPVASAPVVNPAPAPVAPTPIPNPAPVAPVLPPVQVAPAPVAVAVPPPAPAPVPTPPPAAAAPVAVAPTSTPTPVAPVSSAPALVTSVPLALVPSPAVPPTAASHLERIRAIKTAVNSKVGNPVNLVDINNEVGREYMNALLEAMKKLSAGAESEMGAAMSRLEAAYQLVEKALLDHKAKTVAEPALAQTPVVPVLSSTPTLAPAGSVTPAVAAPIPTFVPSPVPPIASVIPPPTPSPVFPAVSSSNPRPLPPPPVALPPKPVPVFTPALEPLRPNPVTPQAPQPAASNVSGFSSTPVTSRSAAPIPVVELAPLPTIVPSPKVATTTSTGPKLGSLADTPKILSPNDLLDPALVEAGRDPLYTREIDNGLEQLLTDWVLFKKSGLFGRGPKGREHPLYKKIAPLPVPLLLAGRFEGASQEIRQSITDYMNGWRYEQGIIYEQGETFEKYLRRVIRHILDLQKKRKQS